MSWSRVLPSLSLAFVGLSVWVGRGVDVGPVNLQAAQIATVVVALALFSAAAVSRRAPLSGLHPTVRALFAAVVVAALLVAFAAVMSSGAAHEPLSVLRFVARYGMGIVLVFALLHFLRSRRSLRTLEGALLVGATASVAIAALGFVIPALGTVTIRYGDRVQGLLNHPNQFAIVLLAVAPIALAVALRAPRQPLRWVVLITVAGGIAFTGSKANLLLLAGGLPLLALIAASLRRGPIAQLRTALSLTVAAGVAAAAAYAVVLRFNPRTLATLQRLFDDPATTSTVQSRREMWERAVQVGLEHPWFGVGADHARFYLPHAHAHNVSIEFFLTMGVAGLVALGALVTAWLGLAAVSMWLASVARSAPFADRIGLVVYPASLLAYVVSNQSSDSFGGTTLPIAWIATALTLGHMDVVLRERASTRVPATTPHEAQAPSSATLSPSLRAG